ncbi:MAG: LacI family DNA-binding transcriptional regulator [Spirochaetota bacterium]
MNITIKKIAELAQVSRGTVDRVLHNRPGVREDVRQRVLEILKELDYTPNLAGRALVHARKQIKIGVVLSPDFNPFVEQVKEGISSESRKIGEYGVELDTEVIRAFDVSEQLEMLSKLQNSDISAVALVPVEHELIRKKINELSDAGIPVVTFNSDISSSKRLCFVGQDNAKAGATVGGLAEMILVEPAAVGIITSTRALSCHQRRIEGFARRLEHNRGISIEAAEENNDIPEVAYELTRKYLESIPQLRLIYLTGGGISGVGKALQEAGQAGRVKVICHDLIPDSIDLLRSGVVQLVIGQDPVSQGAVPIRILFDQLFRRNTPAQEYYDTGIDIFTADNI